MPRYLLRAELSLGQSQKKLGKSLGNSKMFGTEIIWPQVTHVLKLRPQRKLENKAGRDGSVIKTT